MHFIPLSTRVLVLAILTLGFGLLAVGATRSAREKPKPFESSHHAADRERWQYESRFGDKEPVEVLQLLREARAFKQSMPSVVAPEMATQQAVSGDYWIEVGPRPIPFPRGNVSGRIRSIAVTPSGKLYVGSAGGGVWRSDDAGGHWVPLTDDQPSLSLGSIAVDPQSESILYAGTGEYGPRGQSLLGEGLLRSFDAGQTWTQLGGAIGTLGGARIGKLLLHPADIADPESQRVVYVAASSGFWRSQDSGDSWNRLVDGNFSDAVFDPVDPSVVYAARSWVGIYRYVDGQPAPTAPLVDSRGDLPIQRFGRVNLAMVRDSSAGASVLFASMEDVAVGGKFKGIWKSSNGGTVWSRVTGPPRHFADGLIASTPYSESETPGQSGRNDEFLTANALSIGQTINGTIASTSDVDMFRFQVIGVGAMTLEICADRANTGLQSKISLYDVNRVHQGDGELELRKTNGSVSADKRLTTSVTFAPGTYYVSVRGNAGTTGSYQLSLIGINQHCQCGYDQVIAVDPDDPDVIYMGLVSLYRSTDGGNHWTLISDHGGANWVHQDIQTITIDKSDTNVLYVGSDGGIWRSPDRGDTWQSLNGDLGITQSHTICQHPWRDDFFMIGNQDNATSKYDAGNWTWVGNDDGAVCEILSDQEWYFSQQNLNIRKTIDGGNDGGPPVQQGLGTIGAAFIAPFKLSPDPDESDLLIAGGAAGSARYVYQTENGAASWNTISQDLGSTITALAIAENDTSVYYAGLANGEIWKTTDAGDTDWTDITATPLPSTRVSQLAVAPLDWRTVYATYVGFRTGQVFRTTNAGGNWTDIGQPPHSNSPLPDAPVNAIVVDPVYPQTLYVGSDVGIFRTLNGGVDWHVFDHGLPSVAVTDLDLNPDAGPNGVFRAATYGRGAWQLIVGNDACENAPDVGDGRVSGMTRGATTDGDASCGGPQSGRDVWYRYNASCDGEVRARTCDANLDTVLSIHEPGCPASTLNELACNDDCVDDSCTPRGSCSAAPVSYGQPYLIRVAGFHRASGEFDLDLSCVMPHDQCENAISLAVPSAYQGGTRGATPDGRPECDGFADTAPGVWHTVYGTGNLMTASLCNPGTTYDTQLSVYCSGCVDSLCIAANDDFCNLSSQVTWCSAPGRIYHILVHGYGTSAGRYELSVSDSGQYCGPIYLNCSPPNQTCDVAQEVGRQTIGENYDAVTSAAASCAPSNSDVWYRREAHCNGFWTIDTCGDGSLQDTVVSLHDDCSSEELDCNDDTPDCGTRSKVTAPVLAGTTLKIRVADFGVAANHGTFDLNLHSAVAPLAVPWPDLYVAGGTGSLLHHLMRIDPVDQTMTDVGPLDLVGVSGLAYAPGLGLMYAVQNSIDEDRIVTVDMNTAEAFVFANLAYSAVQALAFDSAALTLFAVDDTTDLLLEIDAQTGEQRPIGPLGFADVHALAVDPISGNLYGADVGTDQLLLIDKITGLATAVGPFGSGAEIEGLAFDSVHQLLYGVHRSLDGSGIVVTIDRTTGAVTGFTQSFPDMDPRALGYVEGLPEAVAGQPYNAQLPISGGCPRYWLGDASGLPQGLSLDQTGRIAGTAEESGLFNIVFGIDDSDLSTPAINASIPLRVRPGNDSCARAFTVGDTTTAFVTGYATTDGPDEPLVCDFSSYTDIESDVWFCHEASCSGTLTVDVCDADFDTKIALYDSCSCPAAQPALACNDDACDLQSRLTHPVRAGQRVAVRVGGFRAAQGRGGLTLRCDGRAGGACCLPDSCSIKTEDVCLESGGAYQGDLSTCTPDSDGDGVIDACDTCPDDSSKTAPGACGCGSPDADFDGDGVADCIDNDIDGDGWPGGVDCDDLYAGTHPEAVEIHDRIDNQCAGDLGQGLVDEISGNAGFHFSDKSLYGWPDQTWATEYEAVRSPSPRFPEGCLTAFVTRSEWSDPQVPAAGGVFFYLVRASQPTAASWGANFERVGICPAAASQRSAADRL